MKIGDQVRFLNDVGGGKVTGFKPGGIVLIEDADGFDIPMPQNEVVVIEDEAFKTKVRRTAIPSQKDETFTKNMDSRIGTVLVNDKKTSELPYMNGKEYLCSQNSAPTVTKEVLDENLEARIVRLEIAIQQQEAFIEQQKKTFQKMEEVARQFESRITLLEAENNLRKNEKMMEKKEKNIKKSKSPTNIGDLKIL